MNRFRRLAGQNSYASELGIEVSSMIPPGGSWLDIGCGTGVAVRELASSRPDARIFAFDLEAGLDDGRKVPSNLYLLQADASRLPLTGKFDLITAVHVLHFIGDKQALLHRLEGKLKVGGTLHANWDPLDVWLGSEWERAAPLGGYPGVLRAAPAWGAFIGSRSAREGNRQGVTSCQSLYAMSRTEG